MRATVEPWTPERVAEVCGVQADEVRRAAELFGSLDGFLDAHARDAAWNGHSELAEDFFTLVLMDFHASFPSDAD